MMKLRELLLDVYKRQPFRPLIRWIYMYFILGGIWDGKAGFAWCTLQAFYEYLIVLKVEEMQASFSPQVEANHQQNVDIKNETIVDSLLPSSVS